jgi:hypothetical protein
MGRGAGAARRIDGCETSCRSRGALLATGDAARGEWVDPLRRWREGGVRVKSRSSARDDDDEARESACEAEWEGVIESPAADPMSSRSWSWE